MYHLNELNRNSNDSYMKKTYKQFKFVFSNVGGCKEFNSVSIYVGGSLLT